MKRILLNILCVVLAISCVFMIIWAMKYGKNQKSSTEIMSDGMKQIDENTFYLEDSGVTVHFSDVILSKQNEQRKLIVCTQDASITEKLEKKLIEKIDFDCLKKTQSVKYSATGEFVVDLDKITKKDIIENKEDKTITIKIEHPYVEIIEIDPEKIIAGDTDEGLFARGEITLSVANYKKIESKIRNRIKEKLESKENIEEANDNAIEQVKGVYEPIIKAIDSDYSVIVEYK